MKDVSFLKGQKIAHRGIYDNTRIYENTLASYKRALKYNYIIELDLRLLADGTIICFHDDSATRMFHLDDKIEKLTFDELSYMAKYKIPTFEDVLDLVKGSVPLLIELKTKTRKYLLENKVSELLDNYDGVVAIQSFNIRTLKWFYKNRPNIVIGYLVGKRNYKRESFFKKYDFLNINVNLFSDKRVRKIREDKLVLGYSIKSSEEYDKKASIYDSLICDNLLEIDKL